VTREARDGQVARDRVQREIEDAAETFFPGSVRRVTLLRPAELNECRGAPVSCGACHNADRLGCSVLVLLHG
jgi:hypothetical protein